MGLALAQARWVSVDTARRVFRQGAGFAASAWERRTWRHVGLALAAALVSALLFARIAEDYLTNDPLARWDVSFARWLAGERNGPAVDFFRVVTLLGSPAAAVVIGAVACVFLYRRRHLVEAALLPVVLGGAELLNLILKLSFHRPRPEVASVHLDTYSFPSGHAMISTAAYGALAYIVCRRLCTTSGRVALVAGTAAFIALVCFSRLYLGVHYLSDVLGGVAAGGFWLAVSIALEGAYGDRLARRFAGSRADALGRRLTRS